MTEHRRTKQIGAVEKPGVGHPSSTNTKDAVCMTPMLRRTPEAAAKTGAFRDNQPPLVLLCSTLTGDEAPVSISSGSRWVAC